MEAEKAEEKMNFDPDSGIPAEQQAKAQSFTFGSQAGYIDGLAAARKCLAENGLLTETLFAETGKRISDRAREFAHRI